MTLRIAVVGAGLSGLAAARRLQGAGHDVHVFDKGRRPGGRANTREHGPRRYDHGAQYFTVRDTAVEPWLTAWLESGLVREWAGRMVRLEAGGPTPAKEARRFVAVPGMVDLALHLARPLRVHSGVRIESVSGSVGAWELTDAGQEVHGPFQRVVIAVPAPQAVPLLSAAPQLQARAEAAEMAPCWAAMLSFATPLPADFDGAFVSDGPVSWMARDSSKPGRPDGESWVVHFGPEWTRAHWLDEEADVCERAVEALRRWLGTVPRPTHARAHRWGYALAGDGPEGILYEPELGIGACGDWCVGGRVEGALLSGLEIAGRIAVD